MEKNEELQVSRPLQEESIAVMNSAAFRLIMRVVEEAVYGGPLDRNSTEIKDLYDFMESDNCRINVMLTL